MATSAASEPLLPFRPPPESSVSSDLRLGVRVTMKDVVYTVRSARTAGRPKKLLNNVTAYLEPGQMTALIGPSGCGKTTLVDVLSGRKTQGETRGVILYGRNKPTPPILKKYVGYVEQFDVLLNSLTVYEMLIYTAELKRPYRESFDQKRGCVTGLLEKLLLKKDMHVRIGAQGGLKKRVSIGIALISDPRVLLLDEPTTGLDSYTANETMTAVKNTAADGTTVCSTIHSPTPYTFSLFDRILFLLNGEVAFFGEARNAVEFLEPFTRGMTNVYDNEADWLTTVIVKADREERGPEIAAAFAQSSLKKDVDAFLLSYMEGPGHVEEETASLNGWISADRDKPPLWFAFMTLIKYRTSKQLTQTTFWVARLADKATFLLLLTITFHGMADDFGDPAVQNVVSIMFMLSTFPIFAAGIYAPALVHERPLLYREMNDGMYTTGSYLLMKMVEELLAGVLSTAVITAVLWKVLAMQGNYLRFFLVYFANLVSATGTGYACAALGTTATMANALVSTYTAILLLLAGNLVLPRDLPAYWKVLYHVNYLRFGYGVLMHNTFTSSDDAERAYMPSAKTEGTVLQYYELDGVDPVGWTAMVCFFAVAHLLVAYLCTKFIRHQKR